MALILNDTKNKKKKEEEIQKSFAADTAAREKNVSRAGVNDSALKKSSDNALVLPTARSYAQPIVSKKNVSVPAGQSEKEIQKSFSEYTKQVSQENAVKPYTMPVHTYDENRNRVDLEPVKTKAGYLAEINQAKYNAEQANRRLDEAKKNGANVTWNQALGRKINSAAQGVNNLIGGIADAAENAFNPAPSGSIRQDISNQLRNTELGRQNALIAARTAQRNAYEDALKATAANNLSANAMSAGNFASASRYNPNLGNDKEYDPVYETINRSRRYQTQILGLDSATVNGVNGFIANREDLTPEQKAFQINPYNYEYNSIDENLYHLTDEERAVYNWYYNTGDRQAAAQYLESIYPELEKRRYAANDEEIRKQATKNAVNAIGASIMSPVVGAVSGIAAIPGTIETLRTGRVNPYASYNSATQFARTARGAVADKIAESGTFGAKAASWIYQVGEDIFENGLRTAALGGLGVDLGAGMNLSVDQIKKVAKATSLSPMLLSVFQSTANEAKLNGRTDEEAIALASIAAGAEWFTESKSFEHLFDTYLHTLVGKGSAADWLGQVSTEALEEGGSNIINTIADILLLGDESEWSRSIRKYQQEEHLSESEAKRKAFIDKAVDLVSDVAGGAISGGVLGGGALLEASVEGAEKRQNRTSENTKSDVKQAAAKAQAAADAASERARAGMSMTADQWEQSLDQSDAAKKRRAEIRATGEKYNVSEEAIRTVEAASDSTGRVFHFYSQDPVKTKSGRTVRVNGRFDENSGEIWINSQSKKPVTFIIGHELTHSTELTKHYKALRSAAMEYLKSNGVDVDAHIADVRETYNQSGIKSAQNLSDDEIKAEMVADYVGSVLLTDEGEIDRLVNARHDAAQAIWNWINVRLTKLAGGGELYDRAMMTRAREIYGRALNAARPAENTVPAQAPTEAAAPAGEAANGLQPPTAETPAAAQTPSAAQAEPAAPAAQARITPDQGVPTAAGGEEESYETELARIKADYRAGLMSDEAFTAALDALNEEYGRDMSTEYHGDMRDIGLENEKGEATYSISREEEEEVRDYVDKLPAKTKFSIDAPVEKVETDDGRNLIAVHNVDTANLYKMLTKWGKIPSPSIAIIRDSMIHDRFGENSVIFNKTAIDPKAHEGNRIYDSDAWTGMMSDVNPDVLANGSVDEIANAIGNVPPRRNKAQYNSLEELKKDAVPRFATEDEMLEYEKKLDDELHQAAQDLIAAADSIDYFDKYFDLANIITKKYESRRSIIDRIQTAFADATQGIFFNDDINTIDNQLAFINSLAEVLSNVNSNDTIDQIKENVVNNKLSDVEHQDSYEEYVNRVFDQCGKELRDVIDIAENKAKRNEEKRAESKRRIEEISDRKLRGIRQHIRYGNRYFEAKSSRAIGADEIAGVVLSAESVQFVEPKLIDVLLDMGIPFRVYEGFDSQARMDEVNEIADSVPDARFSISEDEAETEAGEEQADRELMQVGDGIPVSQYSISTTLEPMNLTFMKDENGVTVLADGNGNRIDEVTDEMIWDSDYGSLLRATVKSKDNPDGVISDEDAKKTVDFLRRTIQLMLDTQDIDLIWAVNSTIGFQPVKAGEVYGASTGENKGRGKKGSKKNGTKEKFAAYTANSDPQYSTTIDFTTICKKTQAVIDVMSDIMKRSRRGLTSKEIIDIVYNEVAKAGEPVPCPVCYVFSRWVGLGGLFDSIYSMQNQYPEGTDLTQIRKDLAELSDTISTFAGDSFSKKKNKLYKELVKEQTRLDVKKFNAENMGKEPLTQDEESRLDTLNKQIQYLDQWTWLNDVRLNKNYKPVPAEVLFDINAGKTFAQDYPLTWTYRTTRGPAMGKAATPYADEHLGQIIRGMAVPSAVDKHTLGDLSKDPYLGTSGSLTKSAVKMLGIAQSNARKQNLLNGQRLQSTSDFRYEYALDYMMAFFELQCAAAKAQMYTKVPEMVSMAASCNVETNLSLMPRNDGYDESDTLIFSDVTGMNAADAFRYSSLYDNVQPIIVGINPKHVRLCMRDPRLTFIIPFHASGGTEDNYTSMMRSVEETVTNRVDFSHYQNDTKMSDATPEQKAAYEARIKILTGKADSLTDEEKDAVRNNEILSQLHIRFYGTDVDGADARVDDMYLNAGDKGSGRDSETYQTFLKADQAKKIMPYEFWDKTATNLTPEQERVNGQRFIDYCNSIGVYPRFSGHSDTGTYNAEFDFTDEAGYWRVLPDRKMYNNDGYYHEQKAVNISDFRTDYLLSRKADENIIKKSIGNDPTKVRTIADAAMKRIADERAARGEKNSISEEEDDEYMRAAESGNERKAQAIVDRAAIAWGAERDEENPYKPLDLYHGTRGFGFTEFDMNRKTHSSGMIYATTKTEVAANYAGRDHYAFTRDIGKPYVENATDINDIINNAKSVDGVDYSVLTDEMREQRIKELESEAKKIEDRINEIYPYDSVMQWDEPNEYGTYEFSNALDQINDIFFEISEGDRDEDTGRLNQAAIDVLNDIFEEKDEYDWKTDTWERTSRYKKYLATIRNYLSEHGDEIKKIAPEFYNLYQGYDLTDTAIDIWFNLLPMYTDKELLINKRGSVRDPVELQEKLDEYHNIGAYHLYGNLGEKPLVIDAGGKDWLVVHAPEIMGDDDYHSTDTIAKKARDLGYTGVVIKNVYDGGGEADDYIFFSANQVKSADPITYDDDGNIIPLSERFNPNENDIRYSIDDDKNDLPYNKTALLTEETIDHYLEEYASKTSPNYAQAYITRISPDNFLALTTTHSVRRIIESQYQPLNPQKFKEYTKEQPIFLIIENGEVVGHEGRHRANALDAKGIKSIPVLVFDYSNKNSKTPIDSIELLSQNFDDLDDDLRELLGDRVTLNNLIPLSYANREQIINEFGKHPKGSIEKFQEKYDIAQTLRYSITPEEDEEYMRAVEGGDEETQRRIIDQAADAWAWGKARRGYHQTAADFTVFNTDHEVAGKYDSGMPSGFYIKPTAAQIGIRGDKQMPLYFKANNMLEFYDREAAARYWARNVHGYKALEDQIKAIDQRYNQQFDELDKEFFRLYKEGDEAAADEIDKQQSDLLDRWNEESNAVRRQAKELINDYIRDSDYDGVHLKKDQGGVGKGTVETYVVFDPAQIKSAELVTRDDDGEIIKPSERFSEDNPDIRWSMSLDVPGGEDESRRMSDELKRELLPDTGLAVPTAAEPETKAPRTKGQAKAKRQSADEYAKATRRGADEYAERVKAGADEDASLEILRAQEQADLYRRGAEAEVSQRLDQERDQKLAAADNLTRARRDARAAAHVRKTNADITVPATDDTPGQKKMFDDQYRTRNDYKRIEARAGLSDNDADMVADLMAGRLSPEYDLGDADDPGNVLKVFNALVDYDRASRTVEAYRRQKNGELRETADRLLEHSERFKDKKTGIAYERETQMRNIRDIAPAEDAEAINREYFYPIEHHSRQANDLMREYNQRVEDLGISRKIVKGIPHEYVSVKEKDGEFVPGGKKKLRHNRVSEAYAVQFVGEMQSIMDQLAEATSRWEKYGANPKFEPKRNGISYAAAAQALDEFRAEYPSFDYDGELQRKIDGMKQIYSELLEKMNAEYMRWGYEPMGEIKGYFPHFISDGDNLLEKIGKRLGIDQSSFRLPTEIVGETADRKPGVRWFGNKLERKTNITDYDALEGFAKYIRGAADVIYHTEDIQKIRQFINQIRYNASDKGIREKARAIMNDPTMDDDEKNTRLDELYKNLRFGLSNYVVNLTEYANLLANKRSIHDRGWETSLGRNRVYRSFNNYNRLRAMAAVAGNMTSALTNLIPVAQVTGIAGVGNTEKAFLATIANMFRRNGGDNLRLKSDFLMNRDSVDPVNMGTGEKAIQAIGWLFDKIDRLGSETVWRACYYDNRKKGMSESAAAAAADRQAAGVVADRSKGGMPTLFSSKNPLLSIGTRFMLEANNTISYYLKDIPKERRDKGRSVLLGEAVALFFTWLYNEGFQYLFGRRPAQEPSELVNDIVGDLTGYRMPNTIRLGTQLLSENRLPTAEDFKVKQGDVVKDAIADAADLLPFSGWADLINQALDLGLDIQGGRFPVGDVMPDVKRLYSMIKSNFGEEPWDNQGQIWAEELTKPLSGFLPGGNQAQKTAKGIATMIAGGSYKISGKGQKQLQYPAQNTPGNWARAVIAGKSSLPTATEWVENGFDTLSADETEIYDMLTGYGTDPVKAVDLIKDIKKTVKTDEETKAHLQRQTLIDSDIDPAAKLLYYGAKFASDKEKTVIENMGPEDGTEVIKALDGLKTSDKGIDDLRVLLKAKLSNSTKELMYNTLVSQNNKEKISALKAEGLDFGDYMDLKIQHDLIDAEDLKPAQKANEWSYWLDKQDYTEPQKAAIKENLAFWGMYKAEPSAYEKVAGSGVDTEKAYDIYSKISELEPLPGEKAVSNKQKWNIIVNSDLTDSEQLDVIKAVSYDGEYYDYKISSDYGVNPKTYYDIYVNVFPKYDADGNGSYKQAEIKAALDSVKSLTNQQRAAIWQLHGSSSSAKNNPYSQSVGSYVLGMIKDMKAETVAAKAAADAEKVTTPADGIPTGSGSSSAAASPAPSGGGATGLFSSPLAVPRG